MEPLCIGIVGENGAGKTTAVKLITAALNGNTCKQLRFSALLSSTLQLWRKEINRENLQLVAQAMDNTFGKGTLSHAVIDEAKNMKEDVLFLDGVRWPTDEEAIRTFKRSIIIYVTASPEVRFQRLINRNEKAGEGMMSREQFEKEEGAPNEQFINDIGSRADFVIRDFVNDVTVAPVIAEIIMRLSMDIAI